MKVSLVTEYPIWLIIFCIALGIAAAYFLYNKDSRLKDIDKNRILLLAALRFLTVTFLSFLLLSPLIKYVKTTIEKPIIIFAQDNSESIASQKDSAFIKNQYPDLLSKAFAALSDKYEINYFTFGDKPKKSSTYNYKDKQTDFSNFFDEIKTLYANRNVGAMIVASDGIYNRGINPVFASKDINFQINTIALGDTGLQKDIILSNVKANKTGFLKNKFPIVATVDIKQLKGATTTLKVFEENKELFSKEIKSTSDNFSENVDIEVEPQKVGLHRYRLQLSPNPEEVTTKNNSREIVIDVIDAKQKIVIIGNSPHPDIGAIRSALQLNENFDVESYMVDKFSKNLNEYNLVILHQIPSKNNAATQLLQNIAKADVPVLYILGSLSSITNMNNLKAGLQINQSSAAFDDCSPVVNRNFALFETNSDLPDFLNNVAPLVCPFGDYKITGNSDILFYQKIKNVSTSKPMIYFTSLGNNKIGFITGEGIWRWRLANFVLYNNEDIFNELINKIAHYLALKLNKENFVVNSKKIINENEPVVFDAEVYNQSFELINTSDVSLEINNAQGNKMPYMFAKTTNAYQLDVGEIPVGDYSYVAKTKIGDKEYKKEGKFTVVAINSESQNTIADHQVLYQLASKHNGKMYYANQLDKMIQELNDNKDITPISYTDKNLQDLVHLKWLFFIFLILLSVEWFLRKFWGTY